MLENGEAVKNSLPGLQPEAEMLLRGELTKQQWVVQVDTLGRLVPSSTRKKRTTAAF